MFRKAFSRITSSQWVGLMLIFAGIGLDLAYAEYIGVYWVRHVAVAGAVCMLINIGAFMWSPEKEYTYLCDCECNCGEDPFTIVQNNAESDVQNEPNQGPRY